MSVRLSYSRGWKAVVFVAMFAIVSVSAYALAAEQQPRVKAKSPRGATENQLALRGLDQAMSIEGNPSTLAACVGGRYYNTHALGFATQNTRIKVDIQSGEDIDPTAAMTVLQMGGHHTDGNARSSLAFDDDSGGNLDPRLELTVPYDGHVVLNVGSFNGTFGCYFVKVEVTVP